MLALLDQLSDSDLYYSLGKRAFGSWRDQFGRFPAASLKYRLESLKIRLSYDRILGLLFSQRHD